MSFSFLGHPPKPVRNINISDVIYADIVGDDYQQTVLCPQLLAARVQNVRTGISWAALETASGTYQTTYLARLDNFIGWCEENNIGVMVTSQYAPVWAGGNAGGNLPPSSASSYATFTEYLVNRYPYVKWWECWNEPDLNYSWETSLGTNAQRAAAYVSTLLTDFYPAVKAANPAAIVCAGVTGYVGDATWWEGFFGADPAGLYDMLSTHAYGDPPSHGSGLTPATLVSTYWAGRVIEYLNTQDAVKPRMLTETGWNTGASGISETLQATYVTESLGTGNVFTAADALTEMTWLYQLQDSNQGAYGLFDESNNQKPALTAFQALR